MELWLIVVWIIIGFFSIGIFMFWWIRRSYDYKVRIREVTSSGVRLIDDTVGKIKIDEDKIEFLKLWGGKRGHSELPLPPASAVDYDPKKKKKVVEVWWGPEIGYVYAEDNDSVEGFQPLTTKHRSMMINQIRKKEARKTTSWKEHIPMIVGLGALVFLVAIILIFWGEFMGPFSAGVDRVEALITRANLCGSTAGTQVVG